MISYATTTGRDHRLRWRNGQDVALAAELDRDRAFGLVLDGCGSPARAADRASVSRNEVGARLLGGYLAGWLRRWLLAGRPPTALLEEISTATAAYLHDVARLTAPAGPDRNLFTANHLLCTVVGFVVTPDDAQLFWLGDGHLILNDAAWSLDAGNAPPYAGYAVMDGETRLFSGLQVRERARLARLGVASDGWDLSMLAGLPGPSAPLVMGRWVNQRAGERGQFEDDGALSIWWADGPEES